MTETRSTTPVLRTVVDMLRDPDKPEGLRIVIQGDSSYYFARQISNSRFGYMPSGVAYCLNAKHVQYCVNYCRDNGIKFRVRSGGHQHEGMSSGNNVLVIALSEVYDRRIMPEPKDSPLSKTTKEAWIPVGKQLLNVYNELGNHGKIIPGGGCQSVNVGGLTHGGGWGTLIRKFGFTCDNILAAEIVTADGKIAIISADEDIVVDGNKITDADEIDKYRRLFRGLRGPGGGNFGIVTKFKFKLSQLNDKMTTFSGAWIDKKEICTAIIGKWIKMQCNLDKNGTDQNNNGTDPDGNLSSSSSLRVLNSNEYKEENGFKVRAGIGGRYYGGYEGLANILVKYFSKAELEKMTFRENGGIVSEKVIHHLFPPSSGTGNLRKKSGADLPYMFGGDVFDNFLNTLEDELLEELTINDKSHVSSPRYGAPDPKERFKILPDAPITTCDRPHPHKISSGFPKENTYGNKTKEMVDKIYDFLNNKEEKPTMEVRKYIVFHCLGGAVKKNTDKRYFAYHNKNYLIQVQCWWNEFGNPFVDEPRNEKHVQWVRDFRDNVLKDYVEGAFINFVDKDLVKNPNTPDGRLDLLKIYYANNLGKLRDLKKEVDPDNVFNFPMSIPPA